MLFLVLKIIDSISTHNFLDLELAKRLGCAIEFVPSQLMVVDDGNQLHCNHVSKGFTWSLQAHTFKAEVMLISLGACDMMLCIQWLTTLGLICWDFKQLVMKFEGMEHHLCCKVFIPRRFRWLMVFLHQNYLRMLYNYVSCK